MIQYTLEKIADIVNGEVIGNKEEKISGVQFDSRVATNGCLFVPVVGEKVDGHSFVANLFATNAISASFWNKDNPLERPKGNLIIVEDSKKALQALARYYRNDLHCHFIGITGSVGKTSTKDLIASVVSQKYKTYKTKGNQNNDLGVPLTILNLDETVDYAVCEMGIDDFGVMDRLVEIVRPELTVVTTIGPAHISQLKSLDNIVSEKCKITKHLGNGYCLYNKEAYGLASHLNSLDLTNKPISYGYSDADLIGSDYKFENDYISFVNNNREYHLPLLGKHQILNGLAAIGIANLLNIELELIQKGFNEVVITPHRMQVVKVKEAIIVDDAYNANPVSMAASLKTMCEYNDSFKKTIVLADMLELGDDSLQLHADLANEVDFTCFDNIYLVGQQMSALSQRLNEKGINNHYFKMIDGLKEALQSHLLINNVIFFKGSNSMHLIDVINSLED